MTLATVMTPAMTYGGILYTADTDTSAFATSDTPFATCGPSYTYRIERWDATGAATDMTCGNWGWDGGTATTSSITMNTNIIQFRTIGDMTIQGIYYGNWQTGVWQAKTPKERLREILDSRMTPAVLSSCKPLGVPNDIREIRARETLLRVLGESKYRDFIRRGSISVRAKSGLVYQIFPGHDFTKVYENGKMIDRLCVVLNGDFPPTDSLIMRYLMILNNEQQFRGYAVKHGTIMPALPQQSDRRLLTEIYKELKAA